jgi:adenylate cyclase
MTCRLSEIRACFEGVIPSVIATVSADGVPNVSYLSQIHLVDDEYVALSNQFFSKTVANVRENPRARALVVDPVTGRQYLLDLLFERAESAGDVFEQMAARLKAISSHAGMDAVMRLKSADLYRVHACDSLPVPSTDVGASMPDGRPNHLHEAARLITCLALQSDPDVMLDLVLDRLAQSFGVPCAMVLLHDDVSSRLVTIASRGYALAGVGSEVGWGEGVIGTAAAERRPVRVSDMGRERRMSDAILAAASDENRTKEIPLPGLLVPQSQLAVPMMCRGSVRGVLFAESEERLAFTGEDQDALLMIAGQLAALLALPEDDAPGRLDRDPSAGPVVRPSTAFNVTYHEYDDSVFIDRHYVIKGVPGRLLWYFLRAYVSEGRQEFTNREIRLDPSLRLPELKDNLETRLLLLRRRLDDKPFFVRLLRPGRGRIRLQVDGRPVLAAAPSRNDPA